VAEKLLKRQVILDTETTGISTAEDHRIIEIGCVEMVGRRLTGQTFHQYINPQREIDDGAIEVHGITNEFLADKPLFEDIAEDFLRFIDGAELIIHNAPFDVGFIDHELKKLSGESRRVNSIASVLDTLKMARDKHPGQKNSLDALCKRYEVDNSNRELHGALLDAEILADVYLAMTGGQVSLTLTAAETATASDKPTDADLGQLQRQPLTVLKATDDELAAHKAMLDKVNKASDGKCVWLAEE
jgi:DNA polymerase-3 subunit epsilon